MTELGHKFEDVLNKIRKGELTVTSDKMDVMFEAYDLLKAILHHIEDKTFDKVDIDGALEKLQVIASGVPCAIQEVAKEEAAIDEEIVFPDVFSTEPSEESPTEAIETEVQAELVEGESEPSPCQIKEKTLASKTPETQSKATDATIRVDVSRLDVLMNLVGELVLGRNRLSQIAHTLSEENDSIPVARELSETSSHIDFITTELQMAVMKTRMVPIAKVFNKLPRLIRELSKEMKKEIDLELVGEETELDKSLIEELNDPLLHLIRNAADHGVETPEQRIAAGKAPRGKVIIKAEHEGNHIVISVEDNGKGMDPEKLKQKAIERKILTPEKAAELSLTEVYNLVFLPGFSTAQIVTNVSGRGVGMDVVRTNVLKLKGTIDIQSEMGKGSKFIIKLPLTLAIIQALLVESGKEIFSIPLDSVIEVVRAERSEISSVGGREVIRLRDTVLPLTRLSNVLGSHRNGHQVNWIYTVVIGMAEQRLGVVVDSLLGQKEVVIKSISEYLGTIKGIAGSTILGDGRVIMIVDVSELMKLNKLAA
jgi:two-component system chemotaxis sensor kinase CheA